MCQLKKVWWPWKLIAYRTDAQGSGWPVGAALTAMGGDRCRRCQLERVWWPWKPIVYRTDTQGEGQPGCRTARTDGQGGGGR